MDIMAIRFVGGFARAGTVTPAEYQAAQPDPILAFGPAIAQHMNQDHMAATIAIAEAMVPGLTVAENNNNNNNNHHPNRYIQEAFITRIDSLGMDVKITRDPHNDQQLPGQPQQFKIRLPFPTPVQDRKDVKVAIMQMTNQATSQD
jgi:putative heme iron utilization protein